MDVDRAVAAARNAFEAGSPWSAHDAARPRSHLLWRIGDLIDEHAEEFAELESLDNGKPLASRARATCRWPPSCSATSPAGPPRWRAPRSRCRCPGRRVPRLHAARADRRRRPDHAVELPAADGRLEDRPRARRRQHGRAQAGRADAADRAAPRRAAARGRAARRRRQHRPRLRRRRRRAGRAPRRRQGRLHRPHRGRQEDRAAAAGNLKKVSLELGGKSPNIIFADADLDAAIAGAANGDLLQPGPVLRQRLAPLRPARGLRPGRRGRRRRRRRRSRSATAFDPTTDDGSARSRRSSSRRCWATSAARSPTAPTLVVGRRDAPRDNGYFVQPTVLDHRRHRA